MPGGIHQPNSNILFPLGASSPSGETDAHAPKFWVTWCIAYLLTLDLTQLVLLAVPRQWIIHSLKDSDMLSIEYI
jgi:hypothetical protein